MKRLFSLLLAGALFLNIAILNPVYAGVEGEEQTEQAEEAADTPEEEVVEEVAGDEATEEVVEEVSTEVKAMESEEEGAAFAKGIEQLKIKFIEGGPEFMGIVLVCLIFGLALVIERIIYLNMATTNTKQLVEEIDSALASGGIEAAKEVARNKKGPVASIFYQALLRSDEGIEAVEKSVVAYGGVQMGLLEKGLSWISLFIALAPMLGFMGTVIGMIQAFDKIQATGEMSATNVAGGIKVALLTTVFGLIVGIILQIGYNYLVSKIDALVNDMENASIQLIDVLVKHGK